jgi:NCAIR mutase (PurE)-related protein
MKLDEIRKQAQKFLAGEAEAETLFSALDAWRTAQWPGGTVDLDRQRRCGFPEVIFADGKTTDELCAAIQQLLDADLPVLATRVAEQQAEVVKQQFVNVRHNAVAKTIRIQRIESSMPADSTSADSNTEANTTASVAVVTAGASDRPVAEEALETLRWMEVAATMVTDVGVAGPQRLLEHLSILRTASALVVVAGMEGALPSVVGGHVACPVIAVPTSVGYGASFGGVAPLLSMLNSCAANVTVVNIDAGFKGGYVAGLIARQNSKK